MQNTGTEFGARRQASGNNKEKVGRKQKLVKYVGKVKITLWEDL